MNTSTKLHFSNSFERKPFKYTPLSVYVRDAFRISTWSLSGHCLVDFVFKREVHCSSAAGYQTALHYCNPSGLGGGGYLPVFIVRPHAWRLGLSNWLKNSIQFFVKYYLYSNGFSPEATRGRIEQYILPNAHFFKVGLGNMRKMSYLWESQSKSSCTSDSKMEIFPWLSNIYRWRIYLWNVSYAFKKRAHSSKQRISVRAHATFLSEPLSTQRFIIADTRNLLTFNHMIARFMFMLLICTFASKLIS